MACRKRADLHEVPLLGSSSKDLTVWTVCGTWDKTLPIHAHTLSVTVMGIMHVRGDTAVGGNRQPAKEFRRRNSLGLKSFPRFHGRMATSGQHLQHRDTVSSDLVICNLALDEFAIDNWGVIASYSSFLPLVFLLFLAARIRNARARPSPAIRLSGTRGTQSREESKRSNLRIGLQPRPAQPLVLCQVRGIRSMCVVSSRASG